MSQQTTSSAPNNAGSERTHPDETKPTEIVALYAKLDLLLKHGDPQQALALAGRAKIDSPYWKNAMGVCHLRLGHIQSAVDLFRGLVISGHLNFRQDVPTVWKTNFATALLLSSNLSGCLAALADIQDKYHPSVQKLQTAIARWKNGLTFWQKFLWYTGSEPTQRIDLGFPPGDLE